MKTICLKKIVCIGFIIFILPALAIAADQLFLLRYVPSLRPQTDDLTKNTDMAEYKPIFGAGDKDAEKLNGIVRFGELSVHPGGASREVGYEAEEHIYFVIHGNGAIQYEGKSVPLKQNDFMYIPPGTKYRITNDYSSTVRLLVAGYRIPGDAEVKPSQEVQIANSGDVELQILGWHGPTSQFKLLMGTTESTRDKLAATSQMSSMFIMDFAPHGTNIPHRHPKEEEIYYVLRGTGNMAAGLDIHGNVVRHPTQEGDAFYFAAGTEVGFYSGAKEGEEHPLILALRSADPKKE
ncbi:cupin domain-containing protein [Candidatus Latescibacterota bacterium]